MPAAERAKQFLPFAALKGLEEALERKERGETEQKETDAYADRGLPG